MFASTPNPNKTHITRGIQHFRHIILTRCVQTELSLHWRALKHLHFYIKKHKYRISVLC